VTINSLGFLGFVVVAAAAFHLAPGRWRARGVYPLTTLAFIGLTGPSWAALLAMFGFMLVVWLAIRIVAFRPDRGTLPLLVAAILVLAALDVFSFLASWPCLVSGPIQRFQDFQAQADGMASFRLDGDTLVEALGRMARGWLLVLVGGDFFRHVWQGLKGVAFEDAYPLALGGSQLAFLAYLFCDFAGYTDIVIGAGRLCGLRLPENFDRPYRSSSFLEFWNRWHMTMSNWFRTYVFGPLLKALTVRWPSAAAANLLAAVAFFVTFFLVGIWHGTSKALILAGLLVGLGASVNHWYRGVARHALGKRAFDALPRHVAYRMAAKGLTFAYLCAAIAPLWMGGAEIRSVAGRYGLTGLLISQAFIFAVVAPTAALPSVEIARPRSLTWRCFLIAVAIVIIEMYVFLFPPTAGRFFYQQY
jgi:alginate O-acetyltransferase complex protein AlgI